MILIDDKKIYRKYRQLKFDNQEPLEIFNGRKHFSNCSLLDGPTQRLSLSPDFIISKFTSLTKKTMNRVVIIGKKQYLSELSITI